MRVTLEELYRIFAGHGHITTDSRSIQPGTLFFALKGEHFNGNTFAKQAIESGAAYAMIDEPEYDGHGCLLVDDVLTALQALATMHRRKFAIPVLAITGSNGKTTTKELITAVLNEKFRTVSTIGNLNNHIGVPLTLLRINAETEMAVVEMGANHQGEIAALCAIAEPTHGLVTNIGRAHLGGFGGFEGVVKAKSELYDWLRASGGTAFVNGDNTLLVERSQGINIFSYGKTQRNRLAGEPLAGGKFLELKTSIGNETSIVKTNLVGEYNFENVMAAIAVGVYFNVPAKSVFSAIENYRPSNSRSQALNTGRNEVIMDAYNANPTSMLAALDNFEALKATGKMVILGDMLELGDESFREHLNIVEHLQTLHIGRVILVGPEFRHVAGNRVTTFLTSGEAAQWLKDHPVEQHTVLLKGSRGLKMETVLQYL